MAEYSGISGNSYRLQSTPFAGGGEGDIYNIEGAVGLVAKIYKADKRTTERERKLSVMVSIKPSVMEQYAWPLDVLYENGQFVGYVMPKISGKEKLRNIYVYDKRKGKPWSLYIAIAKNLAAAVHNVHEIHQVIGDLNPENILVNPNDGMVTLVDTDSYHIADSSRTYRCGVGMPEFIAPELQGIHFPSAPLPTFTPETDRFALAVLIFALLMNGAHPFSCKVISGSSSKFQPIDNMQNGKCAFFQDSRSSNMDIPRYAPDLESLPENLQQLFRRAFVSGHGNPSLRPSAEEWYNVLEQLEANLKTCYDNAQHIYYYGAKSCPWCEVDKKMHSIPQTAFNSSSQSGSSSGSYSQPATGAGPAQQFTPSNYRYTPSTSNSGTTPPKKSYGGWIALGAVILVLILIIRSCATSTPKNSVEILTGDSTVSVGETVQIRIKSTTSRVTASYNDSTVSLDWGSTSQSSGYYYIYANITGLSAGNSTLKIYITGDESVYDTISISVKNSGTPGNQNSGNSGNGNSQSDPVIERNDGSSADKAISLSPNTPISGSLSSSSDVKWYTLTLNQPGTINFNMQYPAQDYSGTYWYLYVYTANDKSNSIMRATYYGQASGFDSSVNSDSQLLGLDAGTYYVMISDANNYSSSTYTLTAEYTETKQCEMEPNESYGTASVLTVNQPHVGCLSSSSDIDWYVISLDKPGTINFNMQYPSQEYSGTYWYLYVYTADDSSNSIMRATYYGQASGLDSSAPVNSNSQLLGLDAGTYYVMITDANNYSSSTYTLTAEYTETEQCEMEPNDGYGTASVLTVNQPHVGCLSSSSDIDWYAITLDKPGTITFNMQYPSQEYSGTYWYLYVYTANDSSNSIMRATYYGQASGFDSSVNSNSQLLGLDAGTYYIMITDANNYSSSIYTLTAVYTETALCEMEPNDSYSTASTLTVNQPYVGSLSSSSDVDWYVLTLDSAGTVTFNMQYAKQEYSGTYWYLYVYSANDSSNSLLRCTYYGDNTASDTTYISLSAGTYYVMITDANNFSSSQYTLTAKK